MKNYEYFDQQVDKFLRNQMSEEETVAFMSDLASNAEMKERARVIALMIRSMNQVGIEHDQQIVNYVKELSRPKFERIAGIKSSLNSLWLKVMKYGIAACITCILAFGGYRYYDFRKTVSLGNTEYFAYVADIDLEGGYRGDGENAEVESKLVALFSNVENGTDISKTIRELELLYEQSLSESSIYNNFVDDIAWNLAIAYLKDGDREKPLRLLEDMMERNEGYPEIMQPAQELIKKINNL